MKPISRRQALCTGALCSTALVLPPLGVLVACGRPAAPPSFPSPLLGQALPALGRTLDGAEIDVGALHGRLVVVDFFANYCAPCQHVLPALRALHETHPDVAFIGVSLDEQRSDALAMVTQHRLGFAVVHDRARVVAGRFRVRELPVTFLIDRSAHVRWVAGPEHTPQDIERALDALL